MLVLAVPLDTGEPFILKDMTETEKVYLNLSLSWMAATSVFKAPSKFRLSELGLKYTAAGVPVIPENLYPGRDGHVIGMARLSQVFNPENYSGGDLGYVSYQYGEERVTSTTSGVLKHKLKDDLKNLTAASIDILKQQIWPKYFSHQDEVSIAKGLPWTFFDHQGERSTLFVGQSFSFERTDLIIDHIQQLLKHDKVRRALMAA